MNGKIIWITGASGFIGGAAARHFAGHGWRVVGFDRRRPDLNLPSAAFHVAPIEDWILEAAVNAHGKPQAVFHAAGTGTVGQAQADPARARRDTVDTTAALLNTLARLAPGTRLVYPSSAAVYGNTGNAAPMNEELPLNPVSVYGRDKQEAENLCQATADKGVPTAVIRFFSVYGPGLRKQLPWELGKKILTGGDDIALFGTGNETRDFLHIDDAVGLIAHLVTADLPAHVTVNGGTGLTTTISGFAGKLANALGRKPKIRFSGETKPGDPLHMRADTKRLNDFGYRPRVSLDEGLGSYAAWIKANVELSQDTGD